MGRYVVQDMNPGQSEGEFWQHMEAGLQEKTLQLHSDLALSQQESRDLQERLMVSEATVQAQAEQLKDYRELLCEYTPTHPLIHTNKCT